MLLSLSSREVTSLFTSSQFKCSRGRRVSFAMTDAALGIVALRHRAFLEYSGVFECILQRAQLPVRVRHLLKMHIGTNCELVAQAIANETCLEACIMYFQRHCAHEEEMIIDSGIRQVWHDIHDMRHLWKQLAAVSHTFAVSDCLMPYHSFVNNLESRHHRQPQIRKVMKMEKKIVKMRRKLSGIYHKRKSNGCAHAADPCSS